MSDEDLTFEDALNELEEVVARLESGDLPLEETLELYERGQTLAARCEDALDAAELRLEKLRPAPGGGYESVPFDVES
jgi:exodeoxyribonuclease VII small subunit